MQVISKTYRLEKNIINFITHKANQLSLSQGQCLQRIINEYQKLLEDKKYENDLIKMSKNKTYLKEQEELANANWL